MKLFVALDKNNVKQCRVPCGLVLGPLKELIHYKYAYAYNIIFMDDGASG